MEFCLSPMIIIKKMNPDDIKLRMCQHVPTLKGKDLVLEKLSGLTNVTYAIYVDKEPLFIFKTFSDGFDRQMENRIVQVLSDRELSPRIIFAEDSYRIEEFLTNTRHPTNEQLNDPVLQRCIVEHMNIFHQVPLLKPRPTLSETLFSPEQREQLKHFKRISNKTAGNKQLFLVLFNQVDTILQASEALKAYLLPSEQSSLRLCHNDLNNLNILFEGDKMHFIDYDYVGSNYLAYDIANFIAEASIDYSLPHYPGFTVIKHFTIQEINDIAHMYPDYYPGLELEVRKFMCVSSLYWAVWSIKRFSINKSENFGVAEHGMMRLSLYHHYFSQLSQNL